MRWGFCLTACKSADPCKLCKGQGMAPVEVHLCKAQQLAGQAADLDATSSGVSGGALSLRHCAVPVAAWHRQQLAAQANLCQTAQAGLAVPNPLPRQGWRQSTGRCHLLAVLLSNLPPVSALCCIVLRQVQLMVATTICLLCCPQKRMQSPPASRASLNHCRTASPPGGFA